MEQIFTTIKSPNLKMCLDVGHAHLHTRDVRELFQRHRDKIIVTHLHNNYGENDDHNPLDNGTYNFDEFLSFDLKNVQYFVIESVPHGITTLNEYNEFVAQTIKLLQ